MECIVVQGTGATSKLVNFMTKSWASHVAMRYSGVESEWMVHSTVGGVQPEWWVFFKQKYQKMARYECLFEVADKALDTLVQEIGHKRYDYKAFVGFGVWVLLNKRLGIKSFTKNPFGEMKAFMCTEALVRFFKICNKLDPQLLLKEFDSELTSPGDLDSYMASSPNLFRLLPSQAA